MLTSHICAVLLFPQAVNEAPSPRFLGAHLHPDNFPASFFKKKPKVSTKVSQFCSLTMEKWSQKKARWVFQSLFCHLNCYQILSNQAIHHRSQFKFWNH